MHPKWRIVSSNSRAVLGKSEQPSFFTGQQQLRSGAHFPNNLACNMGQQPTFANKYELLLSHSLCGRKAIFNANDFGMKKDWLEIVFHRQLHSKKETWLNHGVWAGSFISLGIGQCLKGKDRNPKGKWRQHGRKSKEVKGNSRTSLFSHAWNALFFDCFATLESLFLTMLDRELMKWKEH